MKTILAASLLLASTLVAQTPPSFGEKVDVNVVLLDAIVTDSRGSQILGLDKNDFVVRENGVEQTIDSVVYFTNRKLLSSPEEKAPFKAEQVREERYFIIFFDKPGDNAFFERLAIARSAAKEFVDQQMKPGDRVAIVGHDVRLKVYADFTADRRTLRRAIDDAAMFSRGVTSSPQGSEPSILRGLDGPVTSIRTGTVYEALEAVGDALRPLRGRKNLILFSAGIFEPGETVRDGMLLGESRYYDPMVRALNRANVAVYSIGLWDRPPTESVVYQTVSRLASDTNGDYFPYAVTFGRVLKQIEQVNNGYYLLSYYTRHPKGTKGWQQVSVSLRNQPRLRIKARSGYAYGE